MLWGLGNWVTSFWQLGHFFFAVGPLLLGNWAACFWLKCLRNGMAKCQSFFSKHAYNIEHIVRSVTTHYPLMYIEQKVEVVIAAISMVDP